MKQMCEENAEKVIEAYQAWQVRRAALQKDVGQVQNRAASR